MRIQFVVTRADTIAGAQVHVAEIAERLQADGHTVQVLTGPRGPYYAMLADKGVTVRECASLQRAIQPDRDAMAIWQLGRAMRDFAPDLVSTHSTKGGILGRAAARALAVPVLFTAHGWAFSGGVPRASRIVYRNVETLWERLAGRIVCVSDYDRQLGLGAGMSPDRLVTIHNGRPDVPTESQTSQQTKPVRVVMIGRFGQQKDHATLLRAMARVPGFELDLVGDGEGEAQVRALVDALQLGARVHFHGLQRDVTPFLASAHAFALISNWEGFPRSTIEAMRAGLPVVVSDVGGASEAVTEGVTGFCVPRGDVEAVARALGRLVADPELRASLGAAGRRRFEAEFTFERMYTRTLEVYTSLCR